MNTKYAWIPGLFMAFLLSQTACLVADNPYSALPPGTWRGVLQLDPASFVPSDETDESILARENYTKELPEGSLPFLFEVIYDSENEFHIVIHNGEERIKVDDIGFGRNIRTAIDTVYVDFPIYNSYITAEFRENVLDGHWVDRSRGDYRIPFTAQHSMDERFPDLREESVLDLSGRWETTFSPDNDPYPAIGEFRQDGNELYGTFLTETGDYRYLAGTVQDDRFALSAFDGTHAFLFEGKILPDSSLIGSFRSGSHYVTTWEAVRNPEATLANPDSLTYLTGDTDVLSFSFPDETGRIVSLDDPQFAGKVKLVQILGTWCPNCRDETEFLTAYLQKNPSEDLAVIGLAFERSEDPTKARERIATYRQELNIPYPILHGGASQKSEAAKALPMLNQVLSYPTLLFVDRDNRVRRIHTGFSGPATSAYENFSEEFTSYLRQLLNE